MLTAVALGAVGVSLARGLRSPNDYAEAYWLVDYRYGFVRRGLVGSVAGLFGAPDPRSIALGSSVLLAVFVLALGWVVWRLLARAGDRTEAFLAVAVFATSPYLVMSGHLVGYYDNILATAAVVAAALALRGLWWGAGVVGAVAILVHESFLVFGYPLVLLAAWFALRAQGRTARPRGEHLPLLLPVAAFVFLAAHMSLFLDAKHVQEAFEARMLGSGFVRTERAELAASMLTTTFVESLLHERYFLVRRLTDAPSLCAVLPSTAALLCVAWRRLRGRARLGEALAVGAAVGLPLALLAVAWDTERIWSLLIFNAFAVLWLLVETRTAPPLHGLGRAALAAVVVANAFLRIPLMDEEVERFGWAALLALYAPLLGCAAWLVLRPARRAVEVAA